MIKCIFASIRIMCTYGTSFFGFFSVGAVLARVRPPVTVLSAGYWDRNVFVTLAMGIKACVGFLLVFFVVFLTMCSAYQRCRRLPAAENRFLIYADQEI